MSGIWRYLKTESPAFWLICFYLFLEYVRPQTVYPVLNVLPWGQVTLTLCALLAVLEGTRFRFSALTDRTLIVYTAILLASCLTAYSPAASYKGLKLYLSWVLIYFLITNIVNTEKRFFVFMLSFLLYNLKMSQHAIRVWASMGFGWSTWGTNGAPGWFNNSGEFGIEMTVFFPLALFFWLGLRSRFGRGKSLFFLGLAASAAVGMIGCGSRGAIVGGAAVTLFLLLRSRHRVRAAVVTALLVVVSLLIIPSAQMQRFSHAGEDKTSVAREVLWRHGMEIAAEYPVLGIGYNNWIPYYSSHFPDYHDQLPHNIFVQAVSELGYVGLLGFIGMIAATFMVNARTRRMAWRLPDGRFIRAMAYGLDGALVGFMTSGFFVTVLYYPYFWINLAMTSSLYYVAQGKLRQATRRGRARPWVRTVVAPGPSVGRAADTAFPPSREVPSVGREPA